MPSKKELRKIDQIRSCLGQLSQRTNEKDMIRLQELSLSDLGLVNDELRQQAWPILLGIKTKNRAANIAGEENEWLSKQKFANIIEGHIGEHPQ